METSLPTVSVGLPVYNGERFLARALDALLAQTFTDFEIIICDNASQDSTARICAEYAVRDGRIRVYRNAENIGAAPNYNLTVELARGEFFKWVTHDDWHGPRSLELAVAAMRAHPDASLCVTGVSVVDELGTEIGSWIPPADLIDRSPQTRLHRLIWTMGEPHPTYGLHRLSTLRQTSMMESYVGSDRTLLARIALQGPIVPIPDVLHFFTVDRRRPPRRLATYTNPANARQLPLRTWRVLFGHLDAVRRSRASVREKTFLTGSVIGRFAGRDFRRLIAEIVYSARVLAARSIQRS